MGRRLVLPALASGTVLFGGLAGLFAGPATQRLWGPLATPEMSWTLVSVGLLGAGVTAWMQTRLQAGDAAGNTAPADPLSALEAVSREAVHAAGFVVPPEAGGIRLDDLYVDRELETPEQRYSAETALLDRLRKPGITAVLGEPGTGKTSLLWRLHGRLVEQGRYALFLPAGGLLNGLERADHALALPRVRQALEVARKRHRRPVVLVDTLDLMLHDQDARVAVQELLGMVRELDLACVVTSRVGEAAYLDSDGLGIRPYRLLDYSPAEWGRAIRAYSRVFYRPPGSTGPGELDYEQARAELRQAAARGLPLREICTRPLTLRMMFELYAPGLPPSQIDTARLYHDYWERRVIRDQRGADQVPTSGPAGADLSPYAEALGLLMAAAGRPDVAQVDVYDRLAARVPRGRHGLREALRILTGRGVVVQRDGRLAFFHQSFCEYAAGRALATRGGRAVDELVAQVERHPDDLFLAEIAGHALRELEVCSGDASPVVARLVASAEQQVVTTGLRVYARLKHISEPVATRVRELVPAAERSQARQFVDLVPTVVQPDAARWRADLAAAWAHPDPDTRARVLRALTRLAAQDPGAVADFLVEHQCLDWATSPRGHAHVRELPPLLRALYPGEPNWVRQEIARRWDQAATGRQGPVLAALLRAAADLAAEHASARALGAELLRWLDRLSGVGKPEQVEAAGAELWYRTGGPDRPDVFARDLGARLASGEARLADRVAVRGLGRLAAELPPATVERVLAGLVVTQESAARTLVARHVLAPLLAGSDDLAGTVRRFCRDRLADPAAWAPDGPAALIAEALDLAELPARELAACVPDQLPVTRDPAVWFVPPWRPELTLRAAMGGHGGAGKILGMRGARVSDAPEVGSDGEESWPSWLRYLIATPERRVADALDKLLDLAERSGPADGPAEGNVHVLDGIRRPLADFAARLAASETPGKRRQGFAVSRMLVTRGLTRPPAPVWLAARIEGEEDPAAAQELLEFVAAAVRVAPWGRAELELLEQRLDRLRASCREAATGEDTDQRWLQVGVTAQQVLVTAWAHLAPLAEAEDRTQALVRVQALALEPLDAWGLPREAALPLLGQRLSRLAPLAERLLPYDAEAAAGLVTAAARCCGEHDPAPRPTWKRRHAEAWRRHLRQVIRDLRDPRRERLLTDLARHDEELARHAFELLGQESLGLPEWFARFTTDPELRPELRGWAREMLQKYGRRGGLSTWPRALDLIPLRHA
ncbi:NACHT domain-containing protein [Carbonactinospora thermoautotrophica]|uniref:NACHT domain-containing protein n=1 Tax=Carbonactinospora thermoautotrophica TaxID=1469144 RepID=UPI00226F4961|nr:ATP-binding protein [Carbonactinospora thermoautotrophica]